MEGNEIGIAPRRRRDFSRRLDLFRWADYPELDRSLSYVVAEIEQLEGRQRRRSESSARKFREAVRSIVLDFFVAWYTSPEYEVSVSLGKGSYGGTGRYGAPFLTSDAFLAAFNGLVALGYLTVAKRGYKNRATGEGRVTRVLATEKLITSLAEQAELTMAAIGYRMSNDAPEPIVLRKKGERDVPYTDTDETVAMRVDLERINAVIARHWIDIYLSDDEFAALGARMRKDFSQDKREAPAVDFAARRLRRIFNNGDWEQGGRFYGGWWQGVPSSLRNRITIDGKATVEVDYAGMHPAMMYADIGENLDGDPYEIGLPGVPRKIVKRTFNALINAKSWVDPIDGFDERACGYTWREFQKLIVQKHAPINKFFMTGHGLRLQNRDARIANRVMLRFADMGYCCLPIHDSFIVHNGLDTELIEIMNDEYYREVDASVTTKVDKAPFLSTYVPEQQAWLGDHQVLLDMLAYKGTHAAYHRRMDEWFAFKGTWAGPPLSAPHYSVV